MKTELYNGLKRIGIDVDKAVSGFNLDEVFYLNCLVRFFDMDFLPKIKDALAKDSKDSLEISRNGAVLAQKLGMTQIADLINELRGFLLSEDKPQAEEVLSRLTEIYEDYRLYVRNHSYMMSAK